MQLQQLDFLLNYVRRYKWLAAGLAAMISLAEIARLFEPALYRELIQLFENIGQQASPTDTTHSAIVLIIAFVVMHSIAIGAMAGVFHLLNRLQSAIMRDAAVDFVQTVLELSFRFHTDRKSGKMSQEFARGISGIEAFFDSITFSFVGLTIRLSTVFVVFFLLDWRYAIIILLMSIVFCAFVIYTSQLLQQRRLKANEAEDKSSSRALDALINVETVKLFHQESIEATLFQKSRQHWRNSKLYEWDGWTWVIAGQNGIIASSTIVLIGFLIWQLLNGQASVGDAVLIITYVGMVIGALWEFSHHSRRFLESFSDINHFFQYFTEEQEITDAENAKQLQVSEGTVQFKNVSFGYTDDNHILEKVSFTVPAGQSVAFVGPSGVGKSTIMKLLYRFFEADRGKIVIDNQDISQVTQQSLRNALSIVPQTTNLFNASIADNISYGSSGVTQADVERAAKLASAHEFISRLPQGYETKVGEQGVKLSGGEKQRIAIARAFLRDSKILILDEATASLDSQSEHQVQQALDELMHGRTTLIIAHRLSTIMHADKIVVLSAGSVAQVGTHDELLKQGGLYKKLWQLQAGEYNE